MGFSRLLAPFLLLAALVLLPECAHGLADDLLPEQRERIQKLLPRTLGKLEKRAHIRVAVFGDSVSNYASRLPGENHRTIRAWHAVFLRELGDRYLFGGAVQDVRPNRPPDPPVDPSLPPPALPLRGELPPLEAAITGAPTIFLYNYCEDSATAVQALQGLTTDAFDVPLDLAIFMYGSHDALGLNPVANMRDCLEEAVKICKARGTDVIIAAPPLLMDGSKSLLARTRPYAAAARSVAAAHGALFVDAGAALGRFEHPKNEQIPVAELYARQMKAIQTFYQHGEFADVVNPNRDGHNRIAKVAWENLIQGETPEPLGPTGSFLLAEKEGAASELEITVRRPDLVNPTPAKEIPPQNPQVNQPPPTPAVNDQEKKETNDNKGEPVINGDKKEEKEKAEEESRFGGVSLTLLPVDNLWQPQTEDTLEVKDFLRSRAVRQPLVMLRKPNGEGHLQNGNTLQFSALLHEGGTSRLIDLTGPVLPITLDMPVGRLEGVAGDLLMESTVHNPFSAAFQGSLQVNWMEKTQNMDVAVDARSTKPLRLRLPLPTQPNFQAPLILTLTSGEKAFRFERRIEGIRNLALNQPTALLPVDPLAKPTTPPEITCKADPLVFTLQVKLPPVATGKATTKPAARVEVAIDARGPEARGTLGYVDSLPLEVPWQDGAITIKKPKPAVFGSGYDRELDSQNIRANVKTNRDGTRWVTLEIPRVYFYLHQWSLLESGQNTLGLNVTISTLAFTDDAPDGRFLPAQTWKLANTTFPRRDARGLAVLELKSRASGSWSLRIAP